MITQVSKYYLNPKIHWWITTTIMMKSKMFIMNYNCIIPQIINCHENIFDCYNKTITYAYNWFFASKKIIYCVS